MFTKIERYNNVYELKGNSHKLLMSIVRDQNTPRKDFVNSSDRITNLLLEGALGYENMTTEKRRTPTGCYYDHYSLENPKLCYVSILRAAEAMIHRTYQLQDDVAQAFVLIQRDESTHNPHYFYHKFPLDLTERIVYVVDLMLATGGS